MRAIILVLFMVLFILPGPQAMADTLERPSLSDIQACTGDCPSRGMSMETVKSRFGEPEQTSPAVGEPPIMRWMYGDFTVYFENNRVLHVTAHKQGRDS